MSLQFGIAIPPCDHIGKVADAAKRAEALGFDSVWFPDAQLLWRDCFAAMALAADRTSRIKIAAGVTSTDTRHPTVVASGANTLNELAPGRVILGLGTAAGLGHLVNMPATPRSKLRVDIAMVRALLDGDWWDFDGQKARLIGARGRIPIYMTAGGPKVAELAGELADGVIFSVGTTAEALEKSIEQLRPGLEKSGRSLDDIDIVSTAFFYVTDDIERAAAMFKPISCLLAKGAGRAYLERANIEIGDLTKLPPLYPTIAHHENWDEAVRAASQVISDDAAILFAQTFGLFGSVDEISRRINEMRESGINHIFVRPLMSYELPYEAMESFAEAAIGRFSASASDERGPDR